MIEWVLKYVAYVYMKLHYFHRLDLPLPHFGFLKLFIDMYLFGSSNPNILAILVIRGLGQGNPNPIFWYIKTVWHLRVKDQK